MFRCKCDVKNGETLFQFSDDDAMGNDETRSVYLEHFDGKGMGLVLDGNVGSITGEVLISNASLGGLCIGKFHNRVCSYCFKSSSKMKAREDCQYLCYCSSECLKHASLFLDESAASIMSILKLKEDRTLEQYVDTLLLSLICLANASTDIGIITFTHILQLESLDLESSSLLTQASQFLLEHISPVYLTRILLKTKIHLDINTLSRFLAIIQLNAQPLYVDGLPGQPSILTILPVLARVNHSCFPNSSFSYTTRKLEQQDVSKPLEEQHSTDKMKDPLVSCCNSAHVYLIVSIVSIRPIASGEEITVSYISQQCLPRSSRKNILLSAFHFDCCCVRCAAEAKINKDEIAVTATTALDIDFDKFDEVLVKITTAEKLVKFSSQNISFHRQPTENAPGFPYAAYEVCMMILQQANSSFNSQTFHSKPTSPTGVTSPMGTPRIGCSKESQELQLKTAVVIIRVCFVITQCWKLVGAELSLQRLDFLLKGVTVGVNLRRLLLANYGVVVTGAKTITQNATEPTTAIAAVTTAAATTSATTTTTTTTTTATTATTATTRSSSSTTTAATTAVATIQKKKQKPRQIEQEKLPLPFLTDVVDISISMAKDALRIHKLFHIPSKTAENIESMLRVLQS